MTTEIIIALIGLFGGLVGGAASIWANQQFERRKSEKFYIDREKEYVEPLARAAYDLQSRIYNLLKVERSFIAYIESGDANDRIYAVQNSAYLFCNFFGWSEIARQKIHYIDLKRRKHERRISLLLDDISHVLSSDAKNSNFRIFAGEQRALGEDLIIPKGDLSVTVGYNEFLKRSDKSNSYMAERLEKYISYLAKNSESSKERLTLLQNKLIDLIQVIDPEYLRYPENTRSKLTTA